MLLNEETSLIINSKSNSPQESLPKVNYIKPKWIKSIICSEIVEISVKSLEIIVIIHLNWGKFIAFSIIEYLGIKKSNN
jgi:hypothetical protein